MNNTEKAAQIFEIISNSLPDDEKSFKSLYIEKISNALYRIEEEENKSA